MIQFPVIVSQCRYMRNIFIYSTTCSSDIMAKVQKKFKITFIFALLFFVLFILLFPSVGALQNSSSIGNEIENTAYLNSTAVYYSLEKNETGNLNFEAEKNTSTSFWNLSNLNWVQAVSGGSNYEIFNIGKFDFYSQTAVGNEPSANLSLGIQFYAGGSSSSPSVFSGLGLIINNATNGATVGSYAWKWVTVNMSNTTFIKLAPTWYPSIPSGYYNFYLEIKITNYTNLNGLSTFQNPNETNQYSNTNILSPQSPAASLYGWNFSGVRKTLDLSYPSNTTAFRFSYNSPFNISLDLHSSSRVFSENYTYILPTQGTFHHISDIWTTNFTLKWELSYIVTENEIEHSYTATAKIAHIGTTYDTNYTFILDTGYNWLNGRSYENISWNTLFILNVSHLLNSGKSLNASYNAFYINDILKYTIGNYAFLNTTLAVNSGVPGVSEYFIVVTNDYTNLNNESSLPSGPSGSQFPLSTQESMGISSGITAGVVGTIAYVFYRKRS